MRQCELAGGEAAHDVQIEERSKIFDGELIDRLMWRVPPCVVDQAIDTPEAGGCSIDQRTKVVEPGDVRTHEDGLARAVSIDLGLERFSFPLMTRAEHHLRAAFFREDLHASGADPFAAAGDDRDSVVVEHRIHRAGT
jgi:hypothetical protein